MFPERTGLIAIAVAALLTGPLPASAEASSGLTTALDVKAAAGYDSNVFRLNDALSENGGMFTDVDAGFSAEGRVGRRWKLGGELGLAARVHESAVDDGDENRFRVRIGGERKAARRGAELDWALAHTVQDSTYVSRSTGLVAQNSGVEIGDRFDSGRTTLDAHLAVPFSRHTRGLVGAGITNKDYRNDYESLGLDRLDYRAYSLEPGVAFQGRGHELELSVPFTSRRYRDRRASDLLGTDIPGSNLEYRYVGLDARYEYAISPGHALKVRADFRDRSDNEQGYGDSTTTEIGLGWTSRVANSARYSLEATWSSREYDRIPAGSQQLNEEAVQREGYSLVAQYSNLMPGLKVYDVRLFTEARWSSYRNDSNDLFSYDGYQALVGLRKAFD